MRLVMVLAAALCAWWSGAAAADEPLKIRVAWVIPVNNWVPMIYEKKDLMTHYGKSYVADAVHFQATPPMIAALATGDLDVADLSFSAFAIAVENAGLSDLRIIGDEGQDGVAGHTTGNYWVRQDGPIKTIPDLKGKVLATPSAGAALDIPARAMLRKYGLETPRDYTMVEVAFPNMLPMLLEHKVEFMPAPNPYGRDPRLLAIARPLFTVAEAMGGPTQTVVWVAREGFLKAHRAAAVDMMEDNVRATRFFTDPANHAAVMAIAARMTAQPASSFDYIYTKDDPYRDPDMRPNLDYLQRAIDAQHDTGFLKATLDVKAYSGLDVLDEAIARIK